MRNLDSLDAWRYAQETARSAYLLSMEPRLAKHFALIDQIRRAGVSIPANIAEGYALATKAQFIRCLRIALGSAAELNSHLMLLKSLSILPEPMVAESLAFVDREISIIVGLLRKLDR
ncbi:MAG TPA: four helix bundle protein [Gemmatimonadales bacterium]|nr:four helix bundle protein [Gemmatimonadales bacterium]